jgi:VanZ family protein
VIALGLGVSIELVQAPLPYRSCELVDAVADDAVGLAAFSAAAWARGRRRERRG